MKMYEKSFVVRAIMNNKRVGLPKACDIYKTMTDKQRETEAKNFISYSSHYICG